jgi:hypothetical protein
MQALAFRTVRGLVPVPPKVRASLAAGKAKSMLAFFLYARRVADKPCLHSKEQGQEPKNIAVTILSRLGAVVVALAA